METELEKLLKEYETVLRKNFGYQNAVRVAEINGRPVIIIGFFHATGTVMKALRKKAPELIRAARRLAKALKAAGFQIVVEGPTGHYLIPRNKFFRGDVTDLHGLSAEERRIAVKDLPDSLENVPYLWWREGYGAYDAVGKAAGEIHAIPYEGKLGAPEVINPRFLWALRKLAERGPVALFIGSRHVDDLHARLIRGERGEPTEVHRLRWEPKELRWRLVEKI